MTRLPRRKLMKLAMERYSDLLERVSELTEDELEEMLEQERLSDHPRKSFVVKLHQRLSALRVARERQEILDEIFSG